MAVEMKPNRALQAAAFAALGVFAAGLFVPALGPWTGAILGAWLVGTQPPLRGIVLLAAIGIVPRVIFHGTALFAGGWTAWETMLAGVAVNLVPYLLYRLSHGAPFAATLALPLWALTVYGLAHIFLPTLQFPTSTALSAEPVLSVFAVNWFAATLVWLWNRQVHPLVLILGAGAVLAVCIGVEREALPPFVSAWLSLPNCIMAGALGGTLILIWSGAKSLARAGLSPDAVALLRSPTSGDALQLEKGRLVGKTSGERFAVKNGIPQFVDCSALTGLNLKYNRLYQTIGGFYDDSQRVYFALAGISRRAYFMQYLGLLEIKAGDKVLETSVGTGLNFYYLPRRLKLFGLDLSGEMLANAQTYLARQHIRAALILGNAEALPFSDDCMDVVFHSGGINFFDDKAKAIREMIRVAKPGSRILIADETEKLVKKIYERSPVTSGYFKGRETEVSTPVDLVPPEMEEIEVRLLRNDEFYALTFRKPAARR